MQLALSLQGLPFPPISPGALQYNRSGFLWIFHSALLPLVYVSCVMWKLLFKSVVPCRRSPSVCQHRRSTAWSLHVASFLLLFLLAVCLSTPATSSPQKYRGYRCELCCTTSSRSAFRGVGCYADRLSIFFGRPVRSCCQLCASCRRLLHTKPSDQLLRTVGPEWSEYMQ